MDVLTITLIQANLHWEQPEKNRRAFEKKINKLHEPTDLIILPEMFTTGFSMHPDKEIEQGGQAIPIAESMDGPSVDWMHRLAQHKRAVVTGGLIIREQDRYYNRLIWMRPDGSYEHYDKRHLFGYAGEDKKYTAGDRRLITEIKGWKICPLICYDLRFPVWSRNNGDYDLLLYIANWPNKRSFAWRSLLRARAIENQCYTVGVNRVGNDGNGYPHHGHSSIIDPSGEHILYEYPIQEHVYTASLYRTNLQEVRDRLPFLRDRDQFKINP